MKIEIIIDDRIVNVAKRLLKKKNMIIITCLTVITGSILVYAASITVPHSFVEGDLISATQVNENFQTLQQKVNELDTSMQTVQQSVQTVQQSIPAAIPVGTIVPFAGDANSVPDGWKLCDGSEISRNDYAALYAVIGIKWGAGNMGDTFNVPDLRGRFLRGVDKSAGVDPDAGSRTQLFTGGNTGDAVGSYQADETKEHDHNVTVNLSTGCHSGADWCGTANWGVSTYTTTKYGGSETRPVNASVNYIIKY